jgi:hypothetical protein
MPETLVHIKRPPADTGPLSQQLSLLLLPQLYISRNKSYLMLVEDKKVEYCNKIKYPAYVVVSSMHEAGCSGHYTRLDRGTTTSYFINTDLTPTEWDLLYPVNDYADVRRHLVMAVYAKYTRAQLRQELTHGFRPFKPDDIDSILSVMFP